MKRFLLMTALALPMMVMMTGCNKPEKFYIKTWKCQEVVQVWDIIAHVDATLDIRKDGTFTGHYTSIDNEDETEAATIKGQWTLVNDNEVTISYDMVFAGDDETYRELGTLRKSGDQLLWVEMNLTFK